MGTIKKQKLKNRKLLDRQHRRSNLGGERYASSSFDRRRGNRALTSGQINSMDMAAVLHRINALTDELTMLKGVVMKHTNEGGTEQGGSGAGESRKPSSSRDKSLLSQRSLDHAARSRTRSESLAQEMVFN